MENDSPDRSESASPDPAPNDPAPNDPAPNDADAKASQANASDEAVYVERTGALRRFVAAAPSPVLLLDEEWRVLEHSDPWAQTFGRPWAGSGPSGSGPSGSGPSGSGPSGDGTPGDGTPGDGTPGDGTPGEAPAGRASEPLGAFFSVFDDPDDAWHRALAQCLDGRCTLHGEGRPLRLRDGTTFWVDWRVRPWRAPDGGRQGVLLHAADRTGERQAETIRRYVERRFDILVDTISEGVLLMDDSGVFRDCNDAAERILGRPASEIIGTKFSDSRWRGLREDGSPLPNSEFPFWRAFFERESVREEVMGIYPPDEPPRWIRVNAQPLFQDDREEPYAVLVCFDDITDEQLKDEALQTSRDLLSSVLTTSLDGILVFQAVRNQAGRVAGFEGVLANPQAEKMLGVASDEFVGGRLLDALPEHEQKGLFDAYVEVVETGEPFETEIRYEGDAGDTWFQVMAVRIEDGVAVTFRDISERKEAVQAMAAANAKLEQRNRALRDFAYIASHDLQEPLRKISSFSNLVLEDYGDAVDETGHHYLERMQDAAQRMSQLISDLLVYSRVTTRARPFEAVDLNGVLRNVRNDLDMQVKDVDGAIEVADLPTIEADPTQVRQLLQNLVGNALKFHKPDTPPVVEIEATIEPVTDAHVGGVPAEEGTAPAEEDTAPAEARKDMPSPDDALPGEKAEAGRAAETDGRPIRIDAECDEVCRLTVADNGIGFEPKHADRIFSPFKRLHGRSEYSGTGMGLAICRRIVERHGGDITVSSTPGEGTTFVLYLPVARKDDQTPAAGEPATDHASTE
jgi:PAS domain S-box-containing protein